MTFVPLYNFVQILRGGTFLTVAKTFTDVDGTSHTLGQINQTSWGKSNFAPFLVSTSATAPASNIFPTASSASSIPFNTTAVPNVVGTISSVACTSSSTGWNMTFSVVGTGDATINSIFFEKLLGYSSSSSAKAVIFAIKLDNPVYLNSGNNYTANFAFTVDFNEPT